MTQPLAKQMAELAVSIGQYSSRGRKEINQDFHAALLPKGHDRSLKGITLAIADGISSSPLSHEASETIVKALMTDYYCTPHSWSVKTSASRVISATNSWLYSENRKGRISDMNRGRVCTLSSLILKGHKAHIFHIGDSRIWRISGQSLEPLTQDHRIEISSSESYLGRSIGSGAQVEIDYTQQSLNTGDIYILTTDGIHDFWDTKDVIDIIKTEPSLDNAAKIITDKAYANGSNDNLTIQIVRIEQLPAANDNSAVLGDGINLPHLPLPKSGEIVDGFRVIRPIVNSARSHIYLANNSFNQPVVLKFPSIDLRDDPKYLRRFMMEEWIANRINSPHVLGSAKSFFKKSGLYIVTEFVEGQTLRQWMRDNPNPDMECVRNIIEQIAYGLRSFHRKEMLHQDIRPENIMIDQNATVKIIDFGSTYVAGVQEVSPHFLDTDILGTAQYSAPEYFLGYGGSAQSDLFSLAVIAYEMLTGELPFGTKVSQVRTQKDLAKLTFKSTVASKHPLTDWVEHALKKALQPDMNKRYSRFSEFLKDLREPSAEFKRLKAPPLMDKNPVLFWQGLTLIFALTTLYLLIK